MGVYELSGAGSLKTGRTLYPTMNANNGNSYGAMVPIASVTDPSTTGATFSSIPQTYQDLRLVLNGNLPSGTGYLNMRLNGITANYSRTILNGDGTSATSSRRSADNGLQLSQTIPITTSSNVFFSLTIDILNYANTVTYKTALWRMAYDLNGSGNSTLGVGLSQQTAAIASLAVSLDSPNFINSTFTLYGIRAVAS